ncbi:hypothetical protein BDY24DRAFT_324301, partial [Mrakia frigida]|uniref:uncharacterized protein n=1 Tax=Mrakia frigida TaxID=29902 RepID=UPI003FCC272F
FLLLLSVPLSTFAQPLATAPAVVAAPPPSKPLAARTPQMSRRMGRRSKDQTVIKAQRKDYSSFLCPGQSLACPVKTGVKEEELATLADWFKIGFECLEVKKEQKSCGGCATLGAGQDCTAIPNALDTSCELGVCSVSSCKAGFVVGKDSKTCVRKATFKTTP